MASITLDTFAALQGTSAAELTEARALDLRGLSLQNVELLSACPALRILHLSSNLLARVPSAVLGCGRLVKLDLSSNALTSLPGPQQLAQLKALKVFYLHDNQLSSLKACRALAELPCLSRLSLCGNPLARHGSYRHFLVNTIASLRCLDEYLISDEELIEGAHFDAGQYRALSPAAFFELVQPPPRPPAGSTPPDYEALLSRSMLGELSQLSRAHRRVSPVLLVQAGVRARVGRRRAAMELEVRRAARPPTAMERANGQERVAGAAVAGCESGVAARQRDMIILRRLRETGAAQAEEEEEEEEEREGVSQEERSGGHAREILARQVTRDEAHTQHTNKHTPSSVELEPLQGNDGDPACQLYVPLKHILEVESLLPEDGQATVEPSLYYILSAASAVAADHLARGRAASKAAAGVVVRRRSALPRAHHMRLRIAGCRADAAAVAASPSLARPRVPARSPELQAVLARCAAAGEAEHALVPTPYSSDQLMRITLPTAGQVKRLQRQIEQQNGVQSATWDEEPEGPVQRLNVLVVSLTGAELQRAHAATTLTRAGRARVWVQRVRVGVHVLRARAATRMQRSFRNHMAFARLRMLVHMRDRVTACGSNRLYLPTRLLEALAGQLPLHTARLWPEHRICFSFSPAPMSELLLNRSSVGRMLPEWAAPPTPLAEGDVNALPEQSPLSLLTVGVRQPPPPALRSFGRFSTRPYTCLVFQTTVEAKRRVALLAAYGYDLLDEHARHGQMLGQPHAPLLLFTQVEVTWHEAASAIAAGWLGHAVRTGIYRRLRRAREEGVRRAEEEEELRRGVMARSLLWGKGTVPIEALILPPLTGSGRTPGSPGGNLRQPQLASIMESQAGELRLQGLPPVVAVSEGERAVAALREARHAEARGLREELAFSAHMRARRDATALDDARTAAQVSSARAAASTRAATRALRTMEKMLQLRMMQDDETETDSVGAAAKARWADKEEARRRQASEARSAAREALRERRDDARVEQEEIVLQQRMERRQLDLATTLQREAVEQEAAVRARALAEARARRSASTAQLSFAGAFARHHNSMARQLRRGEVRTLQQDQRLGAKSLGEMSRQEAFVRRAAAEARAACRAEARRLGKARHQADVQAGLAERIVIQQHEVYAMRFRNYQLRKIRSFLAVPVEPAPVQPFELGMTRDSSQPYQSRYDDGVDLSQAGAKLGKQYTLVS
jgi:hypothetical protein